MFMVGFEVDVERLRGTWRASIIVGVSALALPMAGVFIVAYYFFDLPILTAGLLSIGLSTTSLALVYNALRSAARFILSAGRSSLRRPPSSMF